MANYVVTVNSDLTVTPDPVQIHGGDTVTWEGTEDFAVHMPPAFNNPHVQQGGGGKWQGTSNPFPGRAEKYKVPYTVSRGGQIHDPDVEVLP